MKKIIVVVLFFSTTNLFGQCCLENNEFKAFFFNHIDNVEAYTLGRKNSQNEVVSWRMFKESIDEIGNYCEVSYDEMSNYSFQYPNLSVFESDKKKWLDWYEKNKCNDLKWIE
ncbi:hypothetical protein [Owenweeksia hongkongensis]|uniref:hypothetical protein n=1 Tax=Owenweeksia hongkongensis TaxID=253245 RepID=UPI003A957597